MIRFSVADALEQLMAVIRQTARDQIMPRLARVAFNRKQDGSLVTEADMAAQSLLQQLLPHIIACPVLGEEMATVEQKKLWQAHQTGLWIVDPIDGTTNFVHGLPYFATSVAFFQNGKPLFGAVYNPALDEMFYAAQHQGAYLNGQRLPLTQPVNTLLDAVAGLNMKHMGDKLTASLLKNPPYQSHRLLGASTLDWCYLAAGRFDIYAHGGQKLWDYAAGSLILTEAEGHFSSLPQQRCRPTAVWQRSIIAARESNLFNEWSRWIYAHH